MDAEKARKISQRAANNWSNQDDARRSPELSHIPSTSSKLGAAKGLDHHVPGFVPGDQTCSKAEPQSDKRWWLTLEPTVRHSHNGNIEDSNALGAECGVYGAVLPNKNVTISEEKRLDEEGNIQKYLEGKDGKLADSPDKAFLDFMKNNQNDKMEKPNVVTEDDLCRVPNKELEESWCVDENWKDLDSYKSSVHEKSEKISSELESHWIEVEKNEPWWRTADKNDLTSLVSCKKLDQFENCDLPQPQSKHWTGPSECTQSFDQTIIFASLGKKVEKETDLDEKTSEIPNSVSMLDTQHMMGDVQCFPSSSDKLIRNDSSATEEEESEALQRLDSDLTKTQLLEALCHSQTRAREAEKAARQAYDEKEHIVKHFFMQASHLFAYRQWLQMLQIETLCLQHQTNIDESLLHTSNNVEGLQPKNNYDESMSAKLPGLLAVSGDDRKGKKARRKATKRGGIPNYKLRRSIVSFALGLSLAGAGLLLGWTLGRFFPAL
ncbi:uncharacterized protein LOC108210558 isoform X2 [Daucus carota subsp. sativus]|uniref:uncharacterized protein LOC108210558 isoform X2 n=1 Tax=Daucus carota subsp. sativus TaxID=79200 RepID=UPI0007EFDE88|nr:PREDICTED: uncharacterized protein LOC108210558 isoform X2 [Daucus carota subsp. sativus]